MIDEPEERETQASTRGQELAELAPRIAGGRIAEGTERIKDYVRRQPVRALGLALGVGVLIGWLAKRR